jgi:hypothetical protein
MADSPITSAADTSKAQFEASIYPSPRSSSADSEQDSEFLDMGDDEVNEETDTDDEADVTADAGMQLLLSFLKLSFCSSELWHMA